MGVVLGILAILGVIWLITMIIFFVSNEGNTIDEKIAYLDKKRDALENLHVRMNEIPQKAPLIFKELVYHYQLMEKDSASGIDTKNVEFLQKIFQ